MNEIEKFLTDKKVRPTAMRILVFRLLAKKRAAMTLSEMEAHFEKTDRTTLYRTIKTFEDNGIVHPVHDGNGIPKYALCEEGCDCAAHNDLHLHFHCNHCEETVCLTDHKIPQINLPHGYTTEDVNMVVNGKCVKCATD
ncbi:MAG: transcriptional repressor [Flavobacteriaceae bacterium]